MGRRQDLDCLSDATAFVLAQGWMSAQLKDMFLDRLAMLLPEPIAIVECRECCRPFEKYFPSERYCSDGCRKEANHRRARAKGPYGAKAATCSDCGKSVWRGSTSSANPTCRECRASSAKPQRVAVDRRPRIVVGLCERCRSEIVDVANRRRRFCSRTCYEAWAIATLTNPTPKRDHRGRISRTVRQRLLRAVIERDGKRCAICRRPVDLSLCGRDHLGPTLDHVIPVAEGGGDDLPNLRLAHMICNATRQHLGGFEQLAMI